MKTGEFFLKKGLINSTQLKKSLEFQKKWHKFIGETLVSLGYLEELDLLKYLSSVFNIQYLSSEKLEKMPIKANLKDIIPEKTAISKNIFPLKHKLESSKLTLLMSEPQNKDLLEELKLILPNVNKIEIVVAYSKAIKALNLKQYLGDLSAFNNIITKRVSLHESGMTPSNESILSEDNLSIRNSNTIEIANRQANRPSFTQIINQGEILSRENTNTFSTMINSNIPSDIYGNTSDYIEIIRVFSNILDVYRGKDFKGHTQRVAILSQKIGKHLGMSDVELNDLTIASYLHDVGKRQHITSFDITDPQKTKTIMKYTALPKRLFSSMKLPEASITFLSNLYETYNGKGYPNGLKLREIPVGSQIILLADTYDVMTYIDNSPTSSTITQLTKSNFFSEQLINTLREIQNISKTNTISRFSPKKAIIISEDKLTLYSMFEELSALNVRVLKTTRPEKAAILMKEHKNTIDLIICDLDITESEISPLRLIAAARRKKMFEKTRFFLFSLKDKISEDTKIKAKALKVSKIFAGCDPKQCINEIFSKF